MARQTESISVRLPLADIVRLGKWAVDLMISRNELVKRTLRAALDQNTEVKMGDLKDMACGAETREARWAREAREAERGNPSPLKWSARAADVGMTVEDLAKRAQVDVGAILDRDSGRSISDFSTARVERELLELEARARAANPIINQPDLELTPADEIPFDTYARTRLEMLGWTPRNLAIAMGAANPVSRLMLILDGKMEASPAERRAILLALDREEAARRWEVPARDPDYPDGVHPDLGQVPQDAALPDGAKVTLLNSGEQRARMYGEMEGRIPDHAQGNGEYEPLPPLVKVPNLGEVFSRTFSLEEMATGKPLAFKVVETTDKDSLADVERRVRTMIFDLGAVRRDLIRLLDDDRKDQVEQSIAQARVHLAILGGEAVQAQG